jgi:GTPase SAR1 family protein
MNVKVWLNEVHEKAPRSVLIFLIGNKLDLEERREVSTEEAKYFADSNGISSLPFNSSFPHHLTSFF